MIKKLEANTNILKFIIIHRFIHNVDLARIWPKASLEKMQKPAWFEFLFKHPLNRQGRF